MKFRQPTLRYRCPVEDGQPPVGTILMGNGLRVRRAYRILTATMTRSPDVNHLRFWKLQVEPMSAQAGREEIAAGVPHWSIYWNKRDRKAR